MFIKQNKIKGHHYGYLAESYRPNYGSAPRHRIIRYLGRVNKNYFSDPTRLYSPMRPSFLEKIPKNLSDYEVQIKEDGVRTIGYFNKSGQALINRRNVNKTEIYPELKDIHKKLNFKKNVVLDGEIVAIKNGKSDFKTLSERDRLKNKELIQTRSKTHPLEYHIFDILELDGKDIKKLPLTERKKILDRVVPDKLKEIKEIRSQSLKKILRQAKQRGDEGIIIKRLDAPYQEGKLSKDWQKLKLLKENDVVILGFSGGTGKREGLFGALLTGVYDPKAEKYRYTGKIGSGFNNQQLKEFKEKFEKLKLKQQPNIINLPKEKNVVFIKPEIVARVKFLNLTKNSIMREGSFVGIREDITPIDTHLSKVHPSKLPSYSSLRLSDNFIKIEKKGKKIKTRKPKEMIKISESIVSSLDPFVKKMDVAGSIRRRSKNISDIDMVIIPKDKESIKNKISSLGNVKQLGDKKASIIHKGVKVDFYFATPEDYESQLFFLTGPTGSSIQHRVQAQKKGWILNQYGLFNRDTMKRIATTERGIYRALGLAYRPPEQRGSPR